MPAPRVPIPVMSLPMAAPPVDPQSRSFAPRPTMADVICPILPVLRPKASPIVERVDVPTFSRSLIPCLTFLLPLSKSLVSDEKTVFRFISAILTYS